MIAKRCFNHPFGREGFCELCLLPAFFEYPHSALDGQQCLSGTFFSEEHASAGLIHLGRPSPISQSNEHLARLIQMLMGLGVSAYRVEKIADVVFRSCAVASMPGLLKVVARSGVFGDGL